MKVIRKEHILNYRHAQEGANIIFLEVCTGVYHVKKNRYVNEEVNRAVDARHVAVAFNNNEKVLVVRMDRNLVANYNTTDWSAY